jgi:hypothetical protein
MVARSRFELLSPGFFSCSKIQSLKSLALNLGDWPLDDRANQYSGYLTGYLNISGINPPATYLEPTKLKGAIPTGLYIVLE